MTSNLTSRAILQSLREQYAVCRGFQPGYGGIPGFTIWNLIRPIDGHPVNSTVSTKTLDAAIAQLQPGTTPAQKMAEFAELRAIVESPIRFEADLDSSGERVVVCASPVKGEMGSCSICDGVEITSIRNAKGEEVKVADDELRWLHSEAEKFA